MKLSFKQLTCLSGALVALGILCGCDHLSDEDLSSAGSRLSITSASPSAVTADVSPSSDPNNPTPDDKVTFGLTNGAAAGSGGDILVLSFDVKCQNGTLDVTGQPAAVPVAAGATADVEVVLASGTYKEANTVGLLGVGADICSVKFHGETLGGDPVSTNEVLVGFTFVDVP